MDFYTFETSTQMTTKIALFFLCLNTIPWQKEVHLYYFLLYFIKYLSTSGPGTCSVGTYYTN